MIILFSLLLKIETLIIITSFMEFYIYIIVEHCVEMKNSRKQKL